jgi:hypothetical protein
VKDLPRSFPKIEQPWRAVVYSLTVILSYAK